MKGYFRKRKENNKKIAKERIDELFRQAEAIYSEDHELANRYVQLARKIQMKYRVRMPSEYKRKFCKHCLHYLVPSKNLRVRIQGNHIVYYCLDCKKFMRFVHKPKKSKISKSKK